jgi:hypothetical protein
MAECDSHSLNVGSMSCPITISGYLSYSPSVGQIQCLFKLRTGPADRVAPGF